MEKAFDKSQLAHFDSNLKAMVDKRYELCLYKSNEGGDQMSSKQACFKNIIVPFRHATHVARDGEEIAYRKCLASRENFPALA